MTAADDGKRRPSPGVDPHALLDAESFWDEQTGQEEVTAPAQPIPTATGPARSAGRTPPPAEDDPDIAVVGPGGLFPGQQAAAPPRLQPPQGVARPATPPQTRPAPPPQARPAPPARRPERSARPARPRPKPQAPAAPEVELEPDGVSPAKIVLALLAVAALSAFLGWFLIGRHAGTEKAKDDSLVQGIDEVPAKPKAEPPAKPAEAPPPAKAPAQAAARTVTIKVDSEPPGALVFVDGVHRGVTPATVRGLPTTGEASLKVQLEGHKPWEQKIALDDEDLVREVKAGLIKLDACKAGTGFLYVTSKPPGATIELDGKRLPGKTPKVINDVCALVPHQIKLQKARYRAWRSEVRIKADDIHNLEVKLER